MSKYLAVFEFGLPIGPKCLLLCLSNYYMVQSEMWPDSSVAEYLVSPGLEWTLVPYIGCELTSPRKNSVLGAELWLTV